MFDPWTSQLRALFDRAGEQPYPLVTKIQAIRKVRDRVHTERSSGRTAPSILDAEEAALLAQARGLVDLRFAGAPASPLPLYDPFIAPLIGAAKQEGARVWIAHACLTLEAVARLSPLLLEHERPGSNPLFAQASFTPEKQVVQVRSLFIGSDPQMKGLFDGAFSAWDEL